MTKKVELEIPALADDSVWQKTLEPYILDKWSVDHRWYKDESEDVVVVRLTKFIPN